jgi:integrase
VLHPAIVRVPEHLPRRALWADDAKAFHALFGRIGTRAKMPFPVHPHMLRHGCGYALANAGHDTRARQAWLGHKNRPPRTGWRRGLNRSRQQGILRSPEQPIALFNG